MSWIQRIADLKYNGVVYNEMKGAFSSPEGVLGPGDIECTCSRIQPYANESGGDPEVIPDLTYEAVSCISTANIIIRPTAISICMVIWIWQRS